MSWEHTVTVQFILNFSGDCIKRNAVKEFSGSLYSGSVRVPNTSVGTGTAEEKVPIYGKVLGLTIIAGYEKKNIEAPAGPGALSLDAGHQLMMFVIMQTEQMRSVLSS